MNIFEAKVAGKKIHLVIPHDVLKTAKKTFTPMNWNPTHGVHEIAFTADNLNKIARLSEKVSSEKLRKNMRKGAKMSRTAPAMPEFKFSTTSQRKMAVPFIKPHLMTVEQAAEIYPEITEMISFADKRMEEEDFEVAGLGISSGTLPPELMDAGGPVLLCRLHP